MPKTSRTVTTATDRAYAELRRRILDETLPEGAPIRQNEMAAELGLSRIPLRGHIEHTQREVLAYFRRRATMDQAA